MKKKLKNKTIRNSGSCNNLFGRVVSILEEARANVVRSVNTEMVMAYWMIGREIVQELQGGDERAEYGKRIIEDLSRKLSARYGSGYSIPNIKSFRQFYQVFSSRKLQISYPAGSQSSASFLSLEKSYPVGSELKKMFHPNLTWSHYRALMRVENKNARDFYESEAAKCNWSKRDLERQISTLFYERILGSRNKAGMLKDAAKPAQKINSIEIIKDPYVLEFLDMPDSSKLHESDLEQAIINNLQKFLLEFGKGFALVARQKRMRFGHQDFYVDLVLYNIHLKCFVLIDLKIGELTHQDIGQMDGYVRMFEEHEKLKGDNPTVGLILCSEKNEVIAKYSVLKESKQLFASKYMLYLPTEKELQKEIQRERKLIESRMK